MRLTIIRPRDNPRRDALPAVARRYAELSGLRATCLAFLPGTATAWANHNFAATTSFVVELPAGSVGRGALARHLDALRAIERGERSGSRTSCAG